MINCRVIENYCQLLDSYPGDFDLVTFIVRFLRWVLYVYGGDDDVQVTCPSSWWLLKSIRLPEFSLAQEFSLRFLRNSSDSNIDGSYDAEQQDSFGIFFKRNHTFKSNALLCIGGLPKERYHWSNSVLTE